MRLESYSSICFTLAEEFSLKKPCFEVDLCGVSVIVMPGGLQLEGRNHIGSSSCTSKGDAGDGKRWDKVVVGPKNGYEMKRAMAIGPWFHSCG